MQILATRTDPPQAILVPWGGLRGYLCPWQALLPLRELVAQIPEQVLWDDEYPTQRHGPWLVSSTSLGLGLAYAEQHGWLLELDAQEWKRLCQHLYIGEPLRTIAEVVAATGRPQPRISEAIRAGRLFAFQDGRSVLIPQRAVDEWFAQRRES